MPLSTGTRLGPYVIEAPLGAGGMGEVYRARDTRLNRDVAIKILPELFASDPERLARFTREAQTLAALNHPNIAQVHGLEDAPAVEGSQVRALVMELVQGEDLSAHIGRGPLAPAEAIAVARQIADALEAAHEQGIVHRDLKPANIKVRPDGTVKVLDFGLAKALAPEGASATADVMHSPTFTARATQLGMILGTAAYMAPEQAKGRPVDKRADIWAFGAVLYEMLAGRRPFEGDDVSDTLAAVLRQDVDWTALPASTPGGLRRLLARCLDRDPRRRLRDIGEARVALEQAATAPEAPLSPAVAPVAKPGRHWAIQATAAALAVAVGVMTWLWWRAISQRGEPTARVAVTLPQDVSFRLILHPVIAIAGDGSKIALVGNHQGVDRLYLRRLNEFEPRLLAGTEDASTPFFSPDGTWLGFFAEGKLKKVPAEGGPVITLADGANDNRGAVWRDDDSIIYTPSAATGLLQIPAAGGTPTTATTIDEAKHERTHRWPALLPDGKTVLVTVGSVAHPDDYDDATIEAIRLDTGVRTVVLKAGRTARYVASGHLLFLRGKILYAVPFDAGTFAVRGTPAPVIDGISGDVTTGSANYDVSENGTVVFVPGDPSGGNRQLVWVDQQGKPTRVDVAPAVYGDPHVSPNGRRVAVSVTTGTSIRDIYVIDTVLGTSSRLTFGAMDHRTPIWTHDGARLIYVAYDRSKNVSAVMIKNADGTGDAQALSSIAGQVYADDLARDDRTLLLSANSSTAHGKFEIFRLALQTGSKPLEVAAATDVQNAALSPDGKWLAYYSVESGRPEVYIQSFLSRGSRSQVSAAGGSEPHWAPDGRALYYQQADGMMRVPIEPGAAFTPGKAQVLFRGAVLPPSTDSGQTYDVDPKGDRFLMLRSANEGALPPNVHMIVNWFDDLRRLGARK